MLKAIFKDNYIYGLLLGLFAPLLGMVGFYFYKFSRLTPWEFIQYLGIEQKLITSMVSFSLLANAVVFTLFINKHIDKTAKGIFTVTCLYAIAVLVLKYWFL